MLLIGEILAHAARIAPDAIAATLDDDAITFGEIDGGEPHRQRARASLGDRARRPGAVVGRHLARGAPGVRRAREARRGVRAAERARIGRRGRDRSPSTPGRGCCSRRPGIAARPPSSPPRPASRSRAAIPTGERDRTVVEPRARRARSARHLLHERQHGRPKGVVLSHRANWLRIVSRRDHRRRAAAGPSACSRCSTWPAGRSRSVPGRAAGRSTSCACPTPRRCCATAARHRAARLYSHPRGVGPHPRAPRPAPRPRRAWSRPTPVRRRRRPSCCTRSRTRCRGPSRGCSTDRPRPARACSSATPTCCASRARVGVPQARRRRAAHRRGEVCLRSPFLMDGYFDAARRDRRGAPRRLVPHRRPRRARRRGLPVDRRAARAT